MYVNLPMENIEEIGEAYPSHLIVILYDEAINSLVAAIDAISLGADEAIQLIVRGFIAPVMDRLPATVRSTVAELVSARLVRLAGGI